MEKIRRKQSNIFIKLPFLILVENIDNINAEMDKNMCKNAHVNPIKDDPEKIDNLV